MIECAGNPTIGSAASKFAETFKRHPQSPVEPTLP